MEIPSAVIAFTIILGIAYWVNSSREDKAVTEAIKAARNEDVALDIMRDVDRQWLLASLSARVRFQSILFPKGLVYDYENHRFGTTQSAINQKRLRRVFEIFLGSGGRI